MNCTELSRFLHKHQPNHEGFEMLNLFHSQYCRWEKLADSIRFYPGRLEWSQTSGWHWIHLGFNQLIPHVKWVIATWTLKICVYIPCDLGTKLCPFCPKKIVSHVQFKQLVVEASSPSSQHRIIPVVTNRSKDRPKKRGKVGSCPLLAISCTKSWTTKTPFDPQTSTGR